MPFPASYLSAVSRLGGAVQVLRRVPLAAHVTIRIGGEAALFLVPETKEALCTLLALSDEYRVNTRILGCGSNLLPSDEGFCGAIISTKKLSKIENSAEYFTAECGTLLNTLISRAAACGMGGLERLFGIPASVGGAVFMNAGAHSTSTADRLVALEVYDRRSGRRLLLPRAALGFSYRESRLQHAREMVALRAFFRFTPCDREELRATVREVCRIRRSTQPLELPSAGSAFRRPPEGEVWRMIDAVGLRGYRIGGAQISEKHAGFIVNRGGATAADVRALLSLCEERVYAACGVRLVREIECF